MVIRVFVLFIRDVRVLGRLTGDGEVSCVASLFLFFPLSGACQGRFLISSIGSFNDDKTTLP